jgi:hypothetical protein
VPCTFLITFPDLVPGILTEAIHFPSQTATEYKPLSGRIRQRLDQCRTISGTTHAQGKNAGCKCPKMLNNAQARFGATAGFRHPPT